MSFTTSSINDTFFFTKQIPACSLMHAHLPTSSMHGVTSMGHCMFKQCLLGHAKDTHYGLL